MGTFATLWRAAFPKPEPERPDYAKIQALEAELGLDLTENGETPERRSYMYQQRKAEGAALGYRGVDLHNYAHGHWVRRYPEGY